MNARSLRRFGAIFMASTLASSAFAQSDPPFQTRDDPMGRLQLPGLSEYAPADLEGFDQANLRTVRLEAKLTDEGAVIEDGLLWRVFGSVPDKQGKLPLVASSEGGPAVMDMPPGEYFVHVAFGRAAVSKKLVIPEEGVVAPQSLTLNAGGVILNAFSGSDRRIEPQDLSFSIYTADRDRNGNRGLILADVKPDTIVRLAEGIYHIVSEYGALNASVRSDIRVEAGKLTEATIQHRAAELTLKLVSEEGGEAIADTAWSVLTASGDPISESVSAYPTLILAEGEYTAIARNKDRVFQRDFTVRSGVNTDVEVMLR